MVDSFLLLPYICGSDNFRMLRAAAHPPSLAVQHACLEVTTYIWLSAAVGAVQPSPATAASTAVLSKKTHVGAAVLQAAASNKQTNKQVRAAHGTQVLAPMASNNTRGAWPPRQPAATCCQAERHSVTVNTLFPQLCHLYDNAPAGSKSLGNRASPMSVCALLHASPYAL
jgi:hypothetical protein